MISYKIAKHRINGYKDYDSVSMGWNNSFWDIQGIFIISDLDGCEMAYETLFFTKLILIDAF